MIAAAAAAGTQVEGGGAPERHLQAQCHATSGASQSSYGVHSKPAVTLVLSCSYSQLPQKDMVVSVVYS